MTGKARFAIVAGACAGAISLTRDLLWNQELWLRATVTGIVCGAAAGLLALLFRKSKKA